MWSEVSFIQDFVSEGERMSQLGYFLAVFQASVEMISNLGVDKADEERKDVHEVGGEDEEKGRKAVGTSGVDDGESAAAASTSLPSPSSVMATSPTGSLSSLPNAQTSSALLTPSVSASSLSSSSSTLSAATASSSSIGEGGEESSAVLHMDMSSLLNDTSQVNNFHFAVPTPDDRDTHRMVAGSGEMKEVAGGGGSGVMGSGSPRVVGRTVPVVEEKKKKRGWLSRRKD